MQNYGFDYKQMVGMQNKYYPMINMPQQDLEKMYPNTYYIIKPVVEQTCDHMTASYGPMYCPGHDHLESMIDDVYNKVEPDVEKILKQSTSEEERQFVGPERRILRDLVGVLLISSLLGRRQPYYYNFPGYYGNYSPYGGYPIY